MAKKKSTIINESLAKEKPKSTNVYVDNEKFYKEISEWLAACKETQKEGKKDPPIPKLVVESIVNIANRLSVKSHFINYHFREDMVGDAILNCITYIKNFDPNKSKNPFSYFTQIVYYSFIQKISTEKKNLYVKFKLMMDKTLNEELQMHTSDKSDKATRDEEEEMTTNIDMSQSFDNMKTFVTDFETREEEKKIAAKKPKPVDPDLFE